MNRDMNRAILAALGAAFFALVGALPAWGDDADLPWSLQQAEPSKPQDRPHTVTLGAGYRLWFADMTFETATATESVDINTEVIHGFELFGEYALTERWSARLGLEFGLATNIQSFVVSLGATYALRDWTEDPLTPYVRGALLIGSLDMDEVAGDFSPGFGIEAGIGVDYSLSSLIQGLAARLELAARWLQFDFDENSDVTSAGSDTGGFGIVLTLGVNYSF